MIQIHLTAQIRRPPADVFALLSQPERETEWQEELVSSRFTSNGPLGVGSTGEDTRKFMGRRLVTAWQVTEYVPPERVTFKVVSGPMPFEGSFRLEPADGGTRLTYEVQSATHGFARLFDSLTRRIVMAQLKKQMTGLKRVLEAES